MEPEFFIAFVNDCIKNLNDSGMSPQKQELLGRLSDKKKQIHAILKPHGKKPPAPRPPPRLDDSTPPNGVSPSFDLRPVVSQQQLGEVRESSQSPSPPKSSSKGKIIVIFLKNNWLITMH